MTTTIVEAIFRAAGVRRWHTEPQVGDPETVAHHSAVVAMLVDYMVEDVDSITPEVRHRLVMHALLHDMGEYWVGDIPAPTKRGLSQQCMAEVDDLEERSRYTHLPFHTYALTDPAHQAIIKLADSLAAAIHCTRQAYLGNRDGVRIMRILIGYLAGTLQRGSLHDEAVIARALGLLLECVAIINDDDLRLTTLAALEDLKRAS